MADDMMDRLRAMISAREKKQSNTAPDSTDEEQQQQKPFSTTPPIFEYLKNKKSTSEFEEAIKTKPELLDDINTKTGRKGTPLLYCLVSRLFSKVLLLLKHGANPSLPDTLIKYGYDTPVPPIFIATGSGSMAAAEALVRAGADLRAKHEIDLDEQGKYTVDLLTATFMRSHKLGDPVAMMDWVITKGKEQNCFQDWDLNYKLPGSLRKTMLAIACAAKAWGTVYLLLENGADPNIADNEGWTPLHTTCMADNPNISLLLMMYGANDSLRTEDDQAWMPSEKADHATKGMVKNGALYRRLISKK